MVLQLLGGGQHTGGRVGPAPQDDETRALPGAGAHHGKCGQARITSIGERRDERVHRIEVVDRDRVVAIPGQRYREGRPCRADAVAELRDGPVYVGSQAVDVNVELILRPGDGGVDCQTDPVRGQGAAGGGLGEEPRPPRLRE